MNVFTSQTLAQGEFALTIQITQQITASPAVESLVVGMAMIARRFLLFVSFSEKLKGAGRDMCFVCKTGTVLLLILAS